METYGWYILKVSVCIMVFYGFYALILRNYTFFLLNRFYLMLGLFLSFIIPVLKFSIDESSSTGVLLNNIPLLLSEPEYDFFQPYYFSHHVTINYSAILSIIYFTGLSVLFFKLLFSIKRIIRTGNHSQMHRIGRKRIIKTDSNLPFSFFNWIFLPEGENNPLIIEHEMAHVRQFHWVDLLLMEIVSVLLWFNPFVILYKKSLKLQHEYLADRSVIQGKNPIGYLQCMLKQVEKVSLNGIISQFYCKTTKKRIVMITKNKTSIKYLGIYLLMVPLASLLLFSFSNPTVAIAQPTSEVIENWLVRPSIYPVDSKKIKGIAQYGERINPITKKKHFHSGIDLAIPEGQEVIATAGGVVVKAQFDSKKGNYVVINHNESFSTLYSHLKSISVEVGKQLEKGQIIGYSGNTGYSTGPHLHYEITKNGNHVDPLDYLPK